MSLNEGKLAPRERRALVLGPVYRILGTPVVAALGLVNTAIVVHQTGEAAFGLVSLVATITLLFPFADLGIGATVLSASAQLSDADRNLNAANVIRRSYHVLFMVAAGVGVVAVTVMALDGWSALIGFSSGGPDRWAVTVAACLFALTIPAGLGVRILIGIDRNPLATVVLMSCPAFALGVTLFLRAIGAQGIWYATSALGGLLIGQMVGTLLALRLTGLGWSAFAPLQRSERQAGLLKGSLWLFLVGVGLPVGLQTGRLILAHLSTPAQLSQYALMAQVYAVCWQVLSTAGMAYWPIFVKRRDAPGETVRMWWKLTAAFAVTAMVTALAMTVLGPWAARVLSGGAITVTVSLAAAFGVLLIGQSVFMPATVLLTRPDEARWQALWTVSMAVVSIGLGCLAAPTFGAVGVVAAAGLAIVFAQVLPALMWVPRLVRSRSPGD
jgi:O-antigen/teichoic acid export membrane protein